MNAVIDAPVKVSALAGKPATPAMLVDVPRLITAYYTELYADAINGGDPVRNEMKWARTLPVGTLRCVDHATLPTARPANDYAARVMPQRSGAAVPLECARILWQ
ncbi:MAG: hypothetical protein WA446_00485 [Steroidobacteraceae bacterium]